MISRQRYDLESVSKLLRDTLSFGEGDSIELDTKFSELGDCKSLLRILFKMGVPLQEVTLDRYYTLSQIGRHYLHQNARREDVDWINSKGKGVSNPDKIKHFYELGQVKDSQEFLKRLDVYDLISI